MSDDVVTPPAARQADLAYYGRAVGQCVHCGTYRNDGQPPVIHHPGCAGNRIETLHMNPDSKPRWWRCDKPSFTVREYSPYDIADLLRPFDNSLMYPLPPAPKRRATGIVLDRDRELEEILLAELPRCDSVVYEGLGSDGSCDCLEIYCAAPPLMDCWYPQGALIEGDAFDQLRYGWWALRGHVDDIDDIEVHGPRDMVTLTSAEAVRRGEVTIYVPQPFPFSNFDGPLIAEPQYLHCRLVGWNTYSRRWVFKP